MTALVIIAVLVFLFFVLAARGQARLNAEKAQREPPRSPRIVHRAATLSLPPASAAELPESGSYCAFVDVETTGLDPSFNEIIEFSIILASFGPTGHDVFLQRAVAHYTGLRQPSHLIPLAAMQVNHITNEMVRGQQLDIQRIRDLARRASFIVAHNARFDRGFACALIPELYSKVWMCSVHSIHWPSEGCSRKSLDYLCEEFQVHREVKHRSLHDALAVMNLVNTIGADGRPFFMQILQNLPIPKPPRQPRAKKAIAVKDPAPEGQEIVPKPIAKKRAPRKKPAAPPNTGAESPQEFAIETDKRPRNCEFDA